VQGESRRARDTTAIPMGCSCQHRRDRQVIGDLVARVAEHRFGLSVRAGDQLADQRARHEAAEARDARQRGDDGEVGVLALGQVDCLRERLIGVGGSGGAKPSVRPGRVASGLWTVGAG
jgi:hypothetical protein